MRAVSKDGAAGPHCVGAPLVSSKPITLYFYHSIAFARRVGLELLNESASFAIESYGCRSRCDVVSIK